MCSKPHKFYTKHTSAGIINHVDGAAVAISGYLPQDILGKLIFDFYHPEDMSFLKEIYETIMWEAQKAGSSFHSKPYRFLIQNGCYITIETEWISFVNPWSTKLEFIVGHHRVLKGPQNLNVFALKEQCPHFTEEALNLSACKREEILQLLESPISRSSDTIKQVVSKRCKVLASFMETLLGEDHCNALEVEVPLETEVTFSERDSVMLGEISPHHDYFDSKSSSETPPSYNQLNYNENLQRFFDSHPVTTLLIETIDAETGGTRTNNTVQGSGESECGGNLSSGSNAQMESITNTSNEGTGTSRGSRQPPMLTEELLYKHNEDMEKNMIKKHKVTRTCGRMAAEKHKKASDKYQTDYPMGHRVKRSGSQSWEGEAHKISKHEHFSDARKEPPQELCSTAVGTPNNMYAPQVCSKNVDLWPPFSVSLTPFNNCSSNNYLTTPNILPALYYIPNHHQQQQNKQLIEHSGSQNHYPAVQYLPGIMYPPQYNASQPQIMYQPTMMYQSMPFPSPTALGLTPTAGNSALNLSVCS